MKQLYALLLLILAAAAFTACDKDQKTLNQLDGTWQIKQVTHLKQDTTKLPSSGSITFTKCDLDGAAKSCPATYTFGSQPINDLTYNVSEKGKSLGMFHKGPYNTYNLSDMYSIVQRNDDRLELEGDIIVLRTPAGANPVTKVIKVSLVLER
ncbi:hypothetical protein [Pontibacter vulgaris]|uniref:hypothetical protein n=1 Tax=Pontibacter vulgaris TaxID=2905679 RepID=UPI001FA7179B|nr:hypothetical protein [Pontibacter vulgaris]